MLFLFITVTVLLFFLISLFTATASVEIQTVSGSADLTGLDLSREVAKVRPEHFDYYPGVYLFPGEFETAPAPRFLRLPTRPLILTVLFG